MTDLQLLEMKISDYILEVVDLRAPRGDIQWVAEATAKVIITEVELFTLKEQLND